MNGASNRKNSQTLNVFIQAAFLIPDHHFRILSDHTTSSEDNIVIFIIYPPKKFNFVSLHDYKI
jgi:hypothetical protein